MSIGALVLPAFASPAELYRRRKERSLQDARLGVGNSGMARLLVSLESPGLSPVPWWMSVVSARWWLAGSHRYSTRRAVAVRYPDDREHAFPEESGERSISDSLPHWCSGSIAGSCWLRVIHRDPELPSYVALIGSYSRAITEDGPCIS